MPEMRIADFLRHDAQTYGVPGAPSIERILEVCVEAANWIDKLEQLLAQVKQERDAAVADITGILETSDCEVRHVYCSRSTPPFECNADECKGYAKWRGVCEENTKER